MRPDNRPDNPTSSSSYRLFISVRIKTAFRQKFELHFCPDALPEVEEHIRDLLIERIPLIIRVERREIGVRIAFVVLGAEPVEAGDHDMRRTDFVQKPERDDDGIVEMLPAALDDKIVVDNDLIRISLGLDVGKQDLSDSAEQFRM